MKKRYLCVAVLLLSLLFLGIQPALGQGFPAVGSEEPPLPPEDPHIAGTLEGTGTYFALEDSEYLNITVESTEPVHLVLESVPEMIVMHLEAAGEASSAVISLGGFPSSTTYYKYEDNYHNEVTFATDDSGRYTYTQDISEPHLVFIQPRAGTYFIPSDTSIGTWDPDTRTYTLTTNVDQTIQIDEDNLTLDGAGYKITGSGSGVYLYSRTGVTVDNLLVTQFSIGVSLYKCDGNTISGNDFSSNNRGVRLASSSSNTISGNDFVYNFLAVRVLRSSNDNSIIGNTVSHTGANAINLQRSSGNTIRGNTVLHNGHGISLFASSDNTVVENAVSDNTVNSINLVSSSTNTISENVVSSNGRGIYLHSSTNNTLTGNTANSNYWYGIYLYSSSDNRVYNNNFINHSTQAYVYGGGGNVFNLDKPDGGNYWSDWTSPDDDGDGFVDFPYVFTGGQDNLPWTKQDGWHFAVANAGGPYLVAVDSSVTLDGSASDPDGDALTLSWWAEAGSLDDATKEDPLYTAPSDAGIFDLSFTATDPGGLSDTDTTYVVVYDPEGGFVTGGGWIWSPAGAYTPDPSLAGWATFGFVSKYKKGTDAPTGQTEFRFHVYHVTGLDFHSTAYDWLVVNQAGTNAQFKGSGTINRESSPTGNDYRFMVWAGDGQPDTFRIRIWWEDGDTEHVVYDNGFDQPIGGGSIVIHQGLLACIPSLISPEEGAVLDNGRTDRLDDQIWDFDWSDCEGAAQYHLYVMHPGALYPVIDDANVKDSSYHDVCQGCYIGPAYYLGWTWRVRAKVGGHWGEWSEMRTFDVEPVNTDPPSP